MPYLIGTDEAGYGPNLGPLTVCGTAWRVPDTDRDIYDILADAISPVSKADRIPICDSKKVYSPSRGIGVLERTVLAVAHSVSGRIPNDVGELLELVAKNVEGDNEFSKLFLNQDVKLPLCQNTEEITVWSNQFSEVCASNDVALEGIDCRVIFPSQFNRLVQRLGNKAELLSSQTLDCVEKLSGQLDDNIVVTCDKHGGRSKYSGMLNQYLTDQFVYIDCESRSISRYHWKRKNHTMQISFKSQGESFCPTALSSMIAKYVREVCMECWNRYWAEMVPGIKPTKGYPLDAKRFKKQINAKQHALGISDQQIWRQC